MSSEREMTGRVVSYDAPFKVSERIIGIYVVEGVVYLVFDGAVDVEPSFELVFHAGFVS